MARPAKVPAALLVEDLDLWPRRTIDGSHVSRMAEALLAGAELPPVIADRDSRRLTDGFHRTRAHLKAFGPQADIEVFWRQYASDADMFEDAVRMNATHGRKLTSYDHARIFERAKELGIDVDRIAQQLQLREATLRMRTKKARTAEGKDIVLKRTLRHMDGQQLNEAQEAYNEHSSGWSPSFHANQLLMAIEAGLPEISENFSDLLVQLKEAIEELNLG